MQLLQQLFKAILNYKTNVVFVINKKEYTYHDLSLSITGIRKAIQEKVDDNEKQIGLITHDDLETYAAILAIWFEGKSYVPLDMDNPMERNKNIIEQTCIKTIIESSKSATYPEYNTIISKSLISDSSFDEPKSVSDETISYILFTSGTTGKPKGVPITWGNLAAFSEAFYDFGIKLDQDDRCLQMFGLNFDLSVMSYLFPMINGARIYTIPKNEIKFSYIFDLIMDEHLTYALMVPSIIHYLRPYFEEIHSSHLKYSLFCGEALPLDVTDEWSLCVPKAKVINVYGPTECTMMCTGYIYNHKNSKKEYNGILSIGKAWKGVETIIIDNTNQILDSGKKGELCLAGTLLTPGYWKNPEKNAEAFFNINYNGKLTRFYKTGDLCYKDSDGDIMYLGRVDFQAKVQGGYRVELSEVELYAKEGLDKINAVAIAYTNKIGATEIGLVIESEQFETKQFLSFLKTKMPAYMMPSKIEFISPFPLNVNGKIDRKKLKNLFE
jgi:D-alanine--poly(phosphoribitol) ligase subunit 1